MRKYRWKVDPEPVGRYRSFQHRGWPMAFYCDNEDAAGMIVCTDSYSAYDAKNCNHEPLTLYVADYSVTPWKWRKLSKKFLSLEEAKDALSHILVLRPEFVGEK